tara:strand:+ start:45 stop:809 length:765 start_codon:yes stop_codon:yes gene_type:complete
MPGKSDKNKINEAIQSTIDSFSNYISGGSGGYASGVSEGSERRGNESFSMYNARIKKNEEENKRRENISNLPPLQGLPESEFGKTASGIMSAKDNELSVPPVPAVEATPEVASSNNTNTGSENPIKVESSNNVSSFNAFNNNKFIGARNLDISTSALENLKKSDENGSKQNKDMKSMFEESNDKNSSSRKRGGLFNNYGKQIKIKKTYDPTTGRTNRQKFVDGELASDRNNNQDMRRQRRSKEARGKRRAGRNK